MGTFENSKGSELSQEVTIPVIAMIVMIFLMMVAFGTTFCDIGHTHGYIFIIFRSITLINHYTKKLSFVSFNK